MTDQRSSEIISPKKYNFLKRFTATLTPEELLQLEVYEEQERLKKAKQIEAYNASIKSEPKEIPKIENFQLQEMKRLFSKAWQDSQNKKLEIRNETEATLYNTLCRYFAKDSSLQNQDFSFAKFPFDLKKGLLILGGFGTGKTSMMMAFHQVGRDLVTMRYDTFMWFVPSNCVQMLSEFENQETDRGEFITKYTKANRYFDDLGREREASKYGKTNIMAEVLENRLNIPNKTTHISSNLSYSELESKYGGAVFSRMHEKLNIIVMDGQDRRKK